MSPQLKQILTEIDSLSALERIEVLSHTIALMKQNLPIESDESILHSRGFCKGRGSANDIDGDALDSIASAETSRLVLQ